MSDIPGERALLNAVERRLLTRGTSTQTVNMTTAEVRWRPVFECRIVRTVESRTEQERVHHGKKDLSGRPTYRKLDAYTVTPPAKAGDEQQWELVLRDSVRQEHCSCGNGEVACDRCQGRGALTCPASRICPACGGSESCGRCDGSGVRRHDRIVAATGLGERVTCLKCGALEAACRGCRGRGRVVCPDCAGTESVPCPRCDSQGTIAHTACRGAGRTVTWTEGLIRHTRSEERVPQPPPHPPLFVRYLAKETGSWRTAALAPGDKLPHDLPAAHQSALKPRLTQVPGEVARCAHLRYLPVVRVMVPDDPHRVFYAFPEQGGPKVVAVPSPRRVAQAAIVILGAAVLLRVLFAVL
ncbi:hypothetical protein [Streptomyces paromomycinus]|uniref:Uncharacterized protein n=1 Tax=Streptomyces paromomycinus TaxID=92743 RepID=A0A401VTK6_STREY|nr:hypothetical protein [Streptomyces paromomycinus]GCD40414.1 hypothetical protein GKJPGBOP_00063 [Streptomyces paromomycinus]